MQKKERTTAQPSENNIIPDENMIRVERESMWQPSEKDKGYTAVRIWPCHKSRIFLIGGGEIVISAAWMICKTLNLF